MTPLAERIEAAEGPDRELDHCIDANKPGRDFGIYKTAERWTAAASHNRFNTPRYTASIDAALTLVPEGCEWSVGWAGNSDAHVNVLPDGPQFDGYAATPALALAAAALRARSSEAERIDDGR